MSRIIPLVLAVLAGLFPTAVEASNRHAPAPVRGRFEPEVAVDRHLVTFSNGLAIDTRAGEPELPAAYRLDGPVDGPALRIVQFAGPIRASDLRALERAGARPFGYLPHYAVLARLDAAGCAEALALDGVTWVGLFQPAYKVQAELLDAVGTVRVDLQVTPGEKPGPVVEFLRACGATVFELAENEFGATVSAALDAADLPGLVRLPGVLWVEKWGPVELFNSDGQWVVQTGWRNSAPSPGDTTARRVWRRGVRGQRTVLGFTDSGLNLGHEMFADPALPVTAPGIWPTHRKVVAYKLYEGATPGEERYHGTHVGGTIAGNDSVFGNWLDCDGMAPMSKLYFVDIRNADSIVGMGNLWALWDSVRHARGLTDSLKPRQHSGSWGQIGTPLGGYHLKDAITDAYLWQYPWFLNIMAAGNSGPRHIASPALAKNVITVGATGNGTASDQITTFSGTGPTLDSRIKPNITAPGEDVVSAAAYPSTRGTASMDGTSMAAPMVNGAVGLMRCYLREGYYPSGSPNPADEIVYPSAALLRSMVYASADPNVVTNVPSCTAGWGRIDVDSVLYFPGDARRLLLCDDDAVATGEYIEYSFFVVSSALPLRVALAWTDTAAAPNAAVALVNDLNLELVAPGGAVYRGNQYLNGQSVVNPTVWDDRNVEECARVNAPAIGTWLLRVRGNNVVTSVRQPYAWTVTGDVADELRDVACTRILAPSGSIDSGTVVTPACSLANSGTAAASYEVSMRIGNVYTRFASVTNHAPGTAIRVQFPSWTARVPGNYVVRCSTRLADDDVPANNRATGMVTVSVKDAAVLSIVAPTGTIDSGTALAPQVRVRYTGIAAASFPVRLAIGAWQQTVNLTLNPDAESLVTFPNWTALERGRLVVRCSTCLAGDLRPQNNRLVESIAVRVRDVAVTRIVAPGALADSGGSVMPACSVYNRGSLFESYPVVMRIGSFYAETTQVVGHAPGTRRLVTFPVWSVTQALGSYAVACTAAMTGDVNPADNRATGTVTVQTGSNRDVGVLAIVQPTALVDSGVVVTPACSVMNFSRFSESFVRVRMRIGSVYDTTATITSLVGGARRLVTFPTTWLPAARGKVAVKCSTMLASDGNPVNNAIEDSVTVTVDDVAITHIVAPAGSLDSGTVVTPACSVVNNGNTALRTYYVTMKIGADYDQTAMVMVQSPGVRRQVVFPAWTAQPVGSQAVVCSTALADAYPADNRLTGAVEVLSLPAPDAALLGIAAPLGVLDSADAIEPRVAVANLGNRPITPQCWFWMWDSTGTEVYVDSLTVPAAMDPGDTVEVRFASWAQPHRGGPYTTRAVALAEGDVAPENDAAGSGFRVDYWRLPVAGGWNELAAVPLAPSGRAVKDGGWLAHDDGSGLVYAAKGYKTGDCYCYDPATDAWTELEPWPLGVEAKPPYKGSVGVSDGAGRIYATKGNNTPGFWCYEAGAWTQLADVPLGLSNKKVKGGTDLVYVPGDTDYVYLLKGYKTEFYRYGVASGEWQSLADAPTGIRNKYDKGSWLALTGDGRILAHKAKYHELYAFDLAAGTWSTQLTGMPLANNQTGKSKKSKDGGCGIFSPGGWGIWALKGGNTQDFYFLDFSTMAWAEKETIPAFGSTAKKKRVKAGADIVTDGEVMYALKGNKTLEFWRYVPGTLDATHKALNAMAGVQGEKCSAAGIALASPNPTAAGRADLRYSLPEPGPARIRVYDVAGREVLGRNLVLARLGLVSLDLRGLAAGVYLVEFQSGTRSAAYRLVLQH